MITQECARVSLLEGGTCTQSTWVRWRAVRVQADVGNVTMLGVEIASMVTDERRKLPERQRIRERTGLGRER